MFLYAFWNADWAIQHHSPNVRGVSEKGVAFKQIRN